MVTPTLVARKWMGQRLLREPAKICHLKRVRLELTRDCSTKEENRVDRESRLTHTEPIKHGDDADWLNLDASLFFHFLHHDLSCRISDITPSGGIEPHTRIGSFDQEQLIMIVDDDCPDGDLWGHIARHTPAHPSQPFHDVTFSINELIGFLAGRDFDVSRHLQDLFEPLLLVLALGEAKPRHGNRGKRLRPSQQDPFGDGALHNFERYQARVTQEPWGMMEACRSTMIVVTMSAERPDEMR